MHACMHACMHAHTHTHTYIPTYLPTYIHACMHTYMHAYIHTYIRGGLWNVNNHSWNPFWVQIWLCRRPSRQRKQRCSQSFCTWTYLHTPFWKWKGLKPWTPGMSSRLACARTSGLTELLLTPGRGPKHCDNPCSQQKSARSYMI